MHTSLLRGCQYWYASCFEL